MIGACLGVGGFFSFAHLGAKRNAWRALTHLRKSWLSREILYVGLFGAGWLVSIAPLPWQMLIAARTITSVLGVLLIYSMSQVYHLQTMPAWNTWRTTVGFFVTAILLGQSLVLNVLMIESQFTGINIPSILPAGITIVLLAVELTMIFSTKENASRTVNRLRVGMIAAAMIGAGVMLVMPNLFRAWITLPILLIVLLEEIIGRWFFYDALNDRIF